MAGAVVLVVCLGGPAGQAAAADPLLGTWRTGPKARDQTAEVRAAAICGTISRIFNSAGQVIAHPNTDKRLFWDMVPAVGGGYEGRVYVPKLARDFHAEARVIGAALKVRGCLGPLCQSTALTRAV